MSSFHLFCDGACSGNPGPGGWGFILVNPAGQVREKGGALNPTTNNQMELTAAIEGLRAITEEAPVEIYTDSSYVINGITKWIFGWKAKGWKTAAGEAVANQEFWLRLYEQTTRLGAKKVRWNYVPGHQGIAGNERADEIAVAMAKNEDITLYSGSLDEYGHRILPVNVAPSAAKSKSKGKPYYLSLVNGELLRHETWSECEARVKNRANAKFKKVTSKEEEKSVLTSWGL